MEFNQITPGYLEVVINDMKFVGVGDRGAAVEEDEEGLLEDAEDGWVAGVEHRVGHEQVHSPQGEQGPLEVTVLNGDLQLLNVTKNLEDREER